MHDWDCLPRLRQNRDYMDTECVGICVSLGDNLFDRVSRVSSALFFGRLNIYRLFYFLATNRESKLLKGKVITAKQMLAKMA